MQNHVLGLLGPSILDPIYVIFAFGSMLSCILWERQKFFRKSRIEALWCPKSVQRSAICDRFVYWMYYECNGIGGPELVCGWSRDHKKRGSDIRLMTFHLFRNVSFVCYPCVMDICINVYVCMHSYTATWLRQSNVCVHTMHILLET